MIPRLPSPDALIVRPGWLGWLPQEPTDVIDDVAPDDVLPSSYQATLHAASKGNVVVRQMRADQGQWITTTFQQ